MLWRRRSSKSFFLQILFSILRLRRFSSTTSLRRYIISENTYNKSSKYLRATYGDNTISYFIVIGFGTLLAVHLVKVFLFLGPCKFGSEIPKVEEISILSGASWISWKPHRYSFRHTRRRWWVRPLRATWVKLPIPSISS